MHFVLLDRAGTPVPVLPEIHQDPTQPLTLPRFLLDKIRGATDYRKSLAKLLESGQQFCAEVAYDASPIFVSWYPDERSRSGTSWIVDCNRSIACVSYLTVEQSIMPPSAALLFEAYTDITDEMATSAMEKHSERPLCLSAVSHDNDALLSASRMGFAAVFLDVASTWSASRA